MYVIMIGDIYGNDTPLYYPDDKEYTIYGTDLHLEVSLCGEFTFNVPKANPAYSQLKEFKIITLLKDGAEIWRGYIKDAKENADKSSMYVYCIEDLSFLKSIPIAPVQQSVDRETKLQSIIAAYNAMTGIAGTVKTFEAGYVINIGTGLWEAEYKTTMLDALRTLAGEDQYVRVRREYVNGVLHRYIDLVTLPYYGIISNQKIEFGENLRDLAKEINTSWMLNVIRPYGNEIEGAEVYDGCPRRLEGTVLSNTTSIEQYGRIEKCILFETSNLADLNSKATVYLEQNKDPRLTLELSAIDLSQAGYNMDSLNLGDKVRVIAAPCNIDQYVYITELNIDIQDLGRNVITLSSTVTTGRSMTEQQATITKEITKKIPDAISILNTAKANTIAILDGSNGGNIYFVFDEYGQIIEQGFADNPDLSLATKISRWNLNGKAILTRDTPQDDWTVKVAETIDGQIVADFITTGHLNASLIDTGTLTAAVIKAGILSDKAGKFSLNMVTGDLAMNSGLFKGNINVNNNFIVDSNGIMQAKRGDFGVLKIDSSDSSIYAEGQIKLMNENVYLETTGSGKRYTYDLIIDTSYFSVATYLDVIFTMYSGASSSTNIGSIRLYRYYEDGSIGTQQESWTIYAENATKRLNTFFYSNNGLYLLRFLLNAKNSYRNLTIVTQTVSTLKALLFNTNGILAPSLRGNLTGRVNATDFNIGGWHFEGNNKRDFLYGEVSTNTDYIKMSIATGFTYRQTENFFSDNYLMRISYDEIYRTDSGTYYYAQFSQGSDERIKHKIVDLSEDLSVEFIDKTVPKSFEYKSAPGTHYGMIAQEVRELLDSMGMEDAILEHTMKGPKELDDIPDELHTLEYIEYIPHLINYVKYLRAENEALRADINEIKQILKERRN